MISMPRFISKFIHQSSRLQKIIVAGAAFILIVLIIFLMRSGDKAVSYETLLVERGSIIIRINSTGTVEPENRLEIKPPVSGRIEQILVKEGDVITKGQILALMSSTERAALLDSARARGENELKRWMDFYRATPLYAPIDGTIINRAAEPGQTVINQDAILVMADRLAVKAQVDETDLAQIKKNQEAQITLDAFPDQVLEATVTHIAYEATIINSVTNYYVDVIPKSEAIFLRSGMTANVDFLIEHKENIIVVPAEGVQNVNGQKMVLGKNNKLLPVTTGITDGKNVEIISGLKEGTSILIEKISFEGAKPNIASPLTPQRPNRTR